MDTSSTSIAITRSANLGRAGKPWRAVALARAALERLRAWARRKEPAAVGPMTHAQEAAEAREYALRFWRTDPRFAADLCAAADRHEIGDGA